MHSNSHYDCTGEAFAVLIMNKGKIIRQMLRPNLQTENYWSKQRVREIKPNFKVNLQGFSFLGVIKRASHTQKRETH